MSEGQGAAAATTVVPPVPTPFVVLLELAKRARAAGSTEELAFLAVNDTRLLVPYRQAALWMDGGGVKALSGVVQPESNAPYAQWLNKVCKALSARAAGEAHRVGAADLPDELAAEWKEWLPGEAVWVPLPASEKHPASRAGGLLLAGDARFGREALALLDEWMHAWRHAWLALCKPRAWFAGRRDAQRRWWRRRAVYAALVALALLAVPVHLTVLASGELVPAHPAVIRAPLDGVIGEFHVRPNDTVKTGQPLFSFDTAPIASRLDVVRQELATAQTEYRQAEQLALTDGRAKRQLATLVGRIAEKRAEADFAAGQLKRTQVVAPQDGVVIFDDPTEWVGRPVRTGERIMRVAYPHDVEIEAWIPVGDAIPVAAGAEVNLYLAASPFSPVTGKLRYLSYDATPRPDGTYAYRLRAALDDATQRRVGLKGTARLSGERVPLIYWILRRPLASIRQFLAW
ncbi:MAG TPA: HlyD family efflux transporter periplasmic adaptor subunit [Burkholderiales bacterium]|nr:HlyD family efflux transporter periplasmic adaptor subunit [Burkholderiales bacterium]